MTASAATEATRSWEQYLQESAVPRSTIDDFIQRPNWATFDPELGYILHDCLVPWGADDSRTIETFRSDGARSRFLYAGRKPRINSYGNSFTECTQVSDGETWQEYLAGHLGEPIGNFGVGGHGVYQAYRRMRRVEQTADGAPYVILYVWGEDPVRSIMRCRWAVFYPWVTPADHEMRLFSSNPWAHLEIDLETGSFTEVDNPLPTPESVYAMCDPQWMLDHLRDDLAMQLAVYAGDPGYGQPGRIGELDRPKIERLAELLNFPLDWGLGTDQRQQAAELLHHYGQRATTWILDKATDQAGSPAAVFGGPPQSIALIEAGATAVSKWWATGLGVAVAGVWATVSGWWSGQEPASQRVALWVAAIVTAAAVLGIAYLLGSDVRGRSTASVANIRARAQVADSMVRASQAAFIPSPSAPSAELVALPAPLEVSYSLKSSAEEPGWKAVALFSNGTDITKYLIAKGAEHEWVDAADVMLVPPA